MKPNENTLQLISLNKIHLENEEKSKEHKTNSDSKLVKEQ